MNATANGPPALLLAARDAAKALAVSEKTLWSNTAPRGACIPAIRVGERSLRYSVAALQKWIDAQRIAAAETNDEQNEHCGDGARLASATGYSPDRAGSDSPALQSHKTTPGGGSTGRNCDRLLN